MNTLESRTRILGNTFKERYGSQPAFIVRAPGRVNLIGEHTDYNEGLVLPVAIDRDMLIAASPDHQVCSQSVYVYSMDYQEEDNFRVDDISLDAKKPWCNYLRGVLNVLSNNGHKIAGFNAVLTGTIPQGSGLSSSAAYEVAVATLANAMFNLGIGAKDIALLSQRAENQFVGVHCGIMDQFISVLAAPDAALLIDCRTLEYTVVPLHLEQLGWVIVVTHSGVVRGLADSQYNERRAQCHEGARLLSQQLGRADIKSLRDVSLAELSRCKMHLPRVILNRCRHVIGENERVVNAVKALELGDMQRFGRLLHESHKSLKDDYEVSCPELDTLVALSQRHPGVIGARMTGAGFGGCTVAIVKADALDSFYNEVIPAYEAQTGKKAEVYICRAVGGASVLQGSVTSVTA